jgi:hypothetical protein
MEKERVYCALGTGSLKIIFVTFHRTLFFFRITLHNHASSKQKAHRIVEMRMFATEGKSLAQNRKYKLFKIGGVHS